MPLGLNHRLLIEPILPLPFLPSLLSRYKSFQPCEPASGTTRTSEPTRTRSSASASASGSRLETNSFGDNTPDPLAAAPLESDKMGNTPSSVLDNIAQGTNCTCN